jgi:serine/threonine protein kinase
LLYPHVPMFFEPGQTVGRTVLHHKLAEGGMASIWVADYPLLGRQVAVKILAHGVLDDRESNDRFALEASVAARVESPYVPEIFEDGVTEDGTPFLVMALVDGVNLKAWVEQNGPLRVDEIARLLEQVAAALGAVHALGVVHRDVKPANIILARSSDGRARFRSYLIDFGIARTIGSSPDARAMHLRTTVGNIGTPSYMSPEQLVSDASIDARTDVWSLGVVIYWCLTGRLPFAAANHKDLCLAIFRGEFVRVTTLRPHLAAALDAWFDKALANDVDRRFGSVATMSRAFAEAATQAPRRVSISLGSQCETVPEFPPSRRHAAPVRRSRARHRSALLCATAGAVLGAAAAYFIVGHPLPATRVHGGAGVENVEVGAGNAFEVRDELADVRVRQIHLGAPVAVVACKEPVEPIVGDDDAVRLHGLGDDPTGAEARRLDRLFQPEP